MDDALLPLLFGGLDYAWDRLSERLDGLTDDEYLWEPVADVWTVRPGADGWVADVERPEPEPAPVTTIAWRTWHIGSSCLAEYVAGLGGWPLDAVSGRQWCGDADTARTTLDTAYAAFRERVHALGEDGVRRPLGPDWGPFADDSWAALLVHALDELAHHGAEIALLRDLYARRG